MKKRNNYCMRGIALALIAVLLLGLCACSADYDLDAVKDDLLGVWSKKDAEAAVAYNFQEDGAVVFMRSEYDKATDKYNLAAMERGTYTVENGVVIVDLGGKYDAELKYTFKNNTVDLKGFTKA